MAESSLCLHWLEDGLVSHLQAGSRPPHPTPSLGEQWGGPATQR